MIITINAGHTLTGEGSGAVGIKNESIENRKVAKEVIKYLKLLGHTVIECTVDKAPTQKAYLDSVVAMANKHKSDYFISIHFNASNGKGHGAEVFTYNGIKLDPAERIVKNIASLGYVNRGVKDGSHLAVIRNTKAKGILIECCFIDNKDDMAKYDADKMARAIVEGLTNQKIIEPKVETVVPKDDKLYKVCIGAFKDRNNALKLIEDAKKKGYTSAYMIIE
jgi:N-acetylmuramoyl-L-alanine amidase